MEVSTACLVLWYGHICLCLQCLEGGGIWGRIGELVLGELMSDKIVMIF